MIQQQFPAIMQEVEMKVGWAIACGSCWLSPKSIDGVFCFVFSSAFRRSAGAPGASATDAGEQVRPFLAEQSFFFSSQTCILFFFDSPITGGGPFENVEVPEDMTADKTIDVLDAVLNAMVRAMEEMLQTARDEGIRDATQAMEEYQTLCVVDLLLDLPLGGRMFWC